jgi:hypothetical protein
MVSTLARDQSSRPATPNWSKTLRWSASNTPALAHSVRRRQQVAGEPQPSSRAGSSRQEVEVRAMYTIAAKQLRSGIVRCRPPYGGRGGAGSRARRSPTAGPARDRPQELSYRGILPDPPKGTKRRLRAVPERVAQEMHRASLPWSAEHLGDRLLEAFVSVGDHQLHATKAAGAPASAGLPPERPWVSAAPTPRPMTSRWPVAWTA